MSQSKAFAVYGAQIDNTKDVVAPLGEISTLSLTQTRDHTIHKSSSYPETALVNFVYRDDAGVEGQLPKAIAANIIMVADWVYDQMRTGKFTANVADFRTAFQAQYAGTYDLGQVGNMVEQDGNFAPAFVTIAPSGFSYNNEWRFWLSNTAFLNQFDVYEHNSVPPVTSIDRFFEPYAAVNVMLGQIDPVTTQQRVNEVRAGDPETVSRVDRFEWVDPTNPSRRLPTYWHSVIYGNAGDNFDNVKAGHRDYILANSAMGAEEWSKIFPSLFASAELIVSPRWDKYALPNMERDTGIWSGIVKPSEYLTLAVATSKGTGYTQAHIENRYEIIPTHYRGLMCCMIPGSDNNASMRTFRDMYPDYANIPYNDIDFGKLSDTTQNFVLKLVEMFEFAETMTDSSSIPQGYQRLVRDDIVYLATGYQDYTLLVVSKFSTDKLFP